MTSEPPEPVPAPIPTPRAPRKLRAPHNLYSVDELVTALIRMQPGGRRMPAGEVWVTWRNGGRRPVKVTDLPAILDVEEVKRVHLRWLYNDNSNLTGYLICRPGQPILQVEHEGQALRAAQAGLEYLEGLRPDRAKLRGLILGKWSPVLPTSLAFMGGAWALAGGTSPARLSLLDAVTLAVIVSVVLGLAYGLLDRRIGGARLVRAPRLTRSMWLSPEAGVLYTLAALIATIVGIAVT